MDTVRQAQVIAFALLVGPALFWAIAHFVQSDSDYPYLVMPIVLAGLVAPAAAYRTYQSSRDRRPRTRMEAEAAFTRTTIIALAITEGAALICCVVFLLTGNQLTYVGFLMHVLLTGAIWPTGQRLASFREGDR